MPWNLARGKICYLEFLLALEERDRELKRDKEFERER
jgi:hypothetical protein